MGIPTGEQIRVFKMDIVWQEANVHIHAFLLIIYVQLPLNKFSQYPLSINRNFCQECKEKGG